MGGWVFEFINAWPFSHSWVCNALNLFPASIASRTHHGIIPCENTLKGVCLSNDECFLFLL
jgi:hypothetical protein